MPHPSEGLSSQYADLQPAGEYGEAPDLPSSAFPNSPFEVEDSASEKFFNEIMTHAADEDDPADAPAPIFQPLPRPVRHVSAPEPHELPQPKPKTAVKKPAKRPRAKKSPTTKRPSSPSHSEAASPWTPEDFATLKEIKTNQKLRPSWKAVAERLKRSEADVKNQWSLYQANHD